MNTLNHQPEEEKNKKRGFFFTFGLHIVAVILAFLPFASAKMSKSANIEQKDAIVVDFSKKPKPTIAEKNSRPRAGVEENYVEPKPKPQPPADKPVTTPVIAPPPTPIPPSVATSDKSDAPSPSSETQPKTNGNDPTAKPDWSGNGDGDGAPKGKPGGDGTGETATISKPDAPLPPPPVLDKALSARRALKRPNMKEKTKKAGEVRVLVCVNPNGKVIRAEAQEFGSTTKDAELWKLGETYARQYEFEADADAPDSQCGYIKFVFKVK